MNIIVIGGAGFLGSHLVDRLLVDGHTVDVIDDLSSGSLANLAGARSMGGSLKIHHLDAGSADLSTLIGMRQPGVIYHLAAIPRPVANLESLTAAFAASANVLESAAQHRVAKVVTALPASAIYGHPASRDLPLKERPLEPRGSRGVIARAIVDLHEVYRSVAAIEFTALALATVYGSRQRPEGGVVAAFQAAADAGTTIHLAGDGRHTRDLIYVDDVVDALVRAGERGSGLVINIGTGIQTRLSDLWTMIAGPNRPDPMIDEPSGDELVRFALSPVRARIHLGWSPWTDLADGLAQL